MVTRLSATLERGNKSGVKSGGRPPATPNKRTLVALDILEKRFPGYDPLVAMAEMAHAQDTDPQIRARLHIELASYLYPKRKPLDIPVSIDLPGDPAANARAVIDAMANGRLTPEQGREAFGRNGFAV